MQSTRRVNGPSQASALARALLVTLALCGAAQASVVIPMTMAEIADNAGQVIVGDVTSVRSYWADNPRRIESEVTLANVEYLKGRLADSSSTFNLIVPGGNVGEWGMHISDAPVFAEGEKCVLFILPTYRTFPVVGLSQGCFRAKAAEDGVERMYTAEGEPVKGLGSDGFVQLTAKPTGSVMQHLVAENNVRVKPPAEPATPREEAMSLADFKAMILPIIAASKSHQLTEPAGRPIFETSRSAQPLHRAGGPLPNNGPSAQPATQGQPAPRGTGAAAQTQNPPRQPIAEKKEGGR